MHSLGLRYGCVIGIREDKFIPVDSKAAFEAAVAEKVRVAVVVRRLVEPPEDEAAESSEMPIDESALAAKLRAQNKVDEDFLLAKLRTECAESRKKKIKKDEEGEIHKRLIALWSKKCKNEDEIDKRLFALRSKKLKENKRTEKLVLDMWFKEREAARKADATKKRSAHQELGRVVSPPCRVRLSGLPGVLQKYNKCACVAERFENSGSLVAVCVRGQMVRVRPECCTLLPWFDIRWEAYTVKSSGPLFFVPDEFAVWRGARRQALDKVWYELKSEGITAAMKMWKEAVVESKKAIAAARVELEEARDEALKEVSNAQESVTVELEQVRGEVLRELNDAREDLMVDAQAAIGEASDALQDEIQNQVKESLCGGMIPQSLNDSINFPGSGNGIDHSDSKASRKCYELEVGYADGEDNKLIVLSEAKQAAIDANDFAKAAALKRKIAEIEKQLRSGSTSSRSSSIESSTRAADATDPLEHNGLAMDRIAQKRAELLAKKKFAIDNQDFKQAAAIKSEIVALDSNAARGGHSVLNNDNGIQSSTKSAGTAATELLAEKKSATDDKEFIRAAAIKREIDALDSNAVRDDRGASSGVACTENSTRASGAANAITHNLLTADQIALKKAELLAEKKSASDGHDFKRAAAIKREIDALDSKATRDDRSAGVSDNGMESSSSSEGAAASIEHNEMTADQFAQKKAILLAEKKSASDSHDFKRAAAIKREIEALDVMASRDDLGAPNDDINFESNTRRADATATNELSECTVDQTAKEMSELEAQKQKALDNKDFKLAAAIKGELKVLEIKQQRLVEGTSSGAVTSPLLDL